MKLLSTLAALTLLSAAAQSQTLEGFDADNATNWRMDFDGTFNGFNVNDMPATYSATGGNPGGHISFTGLSTQLPIWFLNSELNADLTGNFRARNVLGATMDARLISGASPFGQHMYVLLGDDMGTPELNDDILIWSQFDGAQYGFAGVGGFGVLPPGVWTTLTWDFDANSPTLPTGWNVWSFGGTNSGDDDADWNAVIQDVDYMAFVNGAPWGAAVLGTINIDFDNLGLMLGEPGTPFCACDGSGTAAPCGNVGDNGHGCGNSANTGGCELTASGTASAASSSLVLSVEGAVPGATGLFFQGNTQQSGGAGVIFNDGLRCAAGGIVRLQIVSLDGAGAGSSSVDLSAVGGISAGDTRTYQYWYRDANGSPCSGGSNTSNGYEVTWSL